ncbi:protein of unknown function [Paraburkholderia dioscoreae]|uniref:Uncharacterized protein n=1 Tax=Paraburkholderia dioscoreae TaxID=2604047 RepID=A0A5Q4ZSE8_9BURK|nr:protein of unknown function [Paraburkholderia dioscoreae]
MARVLRTQHHAHDSFAGPLNVDQLAQAFAGKREVAQALAGGIE